MQNQGNPMSALLAADNDQANLSVVQIWANLTPEAALAQAREWTNKFALRQHVIWSPHPAVHARFDSTFRRLVLTIYILHRREPPTVKSDTPTLCFGRLNTSLINLILSFAAPITKPTLWKPKEREERKQ